MPVEREQGSVVSSEVRAAYAYLGAVTERPTAQLWDLVDSVGPVEAQALIRTGRVGADRSAEGLSPASQDRIDRAEGIEELAVTVLSPAELAPEAFQDFILDSRVHRGPLLAQVLHELLEQVCAAGICLLDPVKLGKQSLEQLVVRDRR